MNVLRKPALVVFLALFLVSSPALAQDPNQANFELAKKFSSKFLGQFVYGGSVSPKWIGKTDRFWYSYKTNEGTQYWLVDPEARSKVALFDREKLAFLLTEECRKPRDAGDLKISGLKLDKTGETMTFSADSLEFEFNRSTGKLTNKGKKKRAAPATRSRRGRRSSDELRHLNLR